MSAVPLAPTGAPAPAGGLQVVTPGRWDRVLARFGVVDTYFREAYHVASAELEAPGTRPVLLHFGDRRGDVVLPLLLRPIAGTPSWDACSAYGYGGPLQRGAPDLDAFGAALDAWARCNGVVTTFLRLHPLLADRQPLPPAVEMVEVGPTVLWDLAPGRDVRGSMHPHHRRACRRADRAGLEVAVDSRPAGLSGFRELYLTTMRRQHAEPFFYFRTSYWEALLAGSGSLRPVLVEGRLEGRVVAALLCFTSRPWLHYHLGASDDVGRTIGASNRCFLAAAEWARSQGLTGVHLGGGVGGDAGSSLLAFKRRFDPDSEPRTFRVAKIVHDPGRYHGLTGSHSTAGYFPPWRRVGG